MTFLKRFEARLGRYAIPNLTMVFIIGQAVAYIGALLPDGFDPGRLSLNPALVAQGEWWRLITFLFAPPAMGPFFVLFYFLLFNLFGTAVERHLGTFRFNLFLLTGYLASVVAAFVAAGALAPQFGPDGGRFASIAAPNYFLYGSLFLAFARIYPDFVLNLFFVLPIRIRWLALATWGFALYFAATKGWMIAMLIGASLTNYLLFFGPGHFAQIKSGHRRRSFQAKAVKASKAPRHECRVCGLNSDDAPKTLFRYCSQCAGQACYCPEHIRDHEHQGKADAAEE